MGAVCRCLHRDFVPGSDEVSLSSAPAARQSPLAQALRRGDLLAVGAVALAARVSISAGRPSKRGSERNARKPRSPISPSPMFAWWSRLAPSGTFESLTCRQRSRSSPTLASNSSTTSRERLRRSDLEARGEQVAAVEADADPLAAAGRLDQIASSSKSRPSGPWVPAVFSSRIGQLSVSSSALRIALPARFTDGLVAAPPCARRRGGRRRRRRSRRRRRARASSDRQRLALDVALLARRELIR